jgi:hypothetical protein
MIYVKDVVLDGTYLLNLQITSFENDASPSKPVLYADSKTWSNCVKIWIWSYYEYCLSKKELEHFPFDDDALVLRWEVKYCLTSLQKWELGIPSVNLKCDPDRAQNEQSMSL